ncbi:hypothetical protein SLE2022_060000 [Rubroshorea leprosula]
MFYSQFILAKKGPLGTIWIAAHLERKLRKNQVADTDIGVSVDSILFPEVPIALRLSSHLLLGVVRIYSRKVNYLFDDCSEALLKVKQAFRSATVDLPPEESTAPYHSITLPETFDLDDFELPDNEIFQGNYVDHHVSSREQITLQDTMDGVVYSTSQFGLDERFGDGDTSHIGLDLDEELFLDKDAAPGDNGVSKTDPQGSDETLTIIKKDASNSEAMLVDDDDGDQIEDPRANNEFFEYAQAPATPGVVELPNLSSVQEALACDDCIGPEDQDVTQSAAAECGENISNKMNLQPMDKNIVSGSVQNDLNHGFVVSTAPENGCHSGDVEKELRKSLENTESNAMYEADATLGGQDGLNRIESNGGVKSLDRTDGDYAESPSCSNVTYDTEDAGRRMTSNSNFVPVSDGYLKNDQATVEQSDHHDAETTKNSNVVDDEVQACLKPKNYVQEEVSSACMHVLQPCTSLQAQPDMSSFGGEHLEVLPNVQSEVAGQGERCQNEVPEHVPGEEILRDGGNSGEQPDNLISCDNQLENSNDRGTFEAPAPEKLLSVPEGLIDEPTNLLVESTPDKEILGGTAGIDARTRLFSGRKRNYTESTLTVESINSVESFGQTRTKKTADSIPDDDDLLSSILVGRKSSVWKMKPAPAFEVASAKRARSAPRPTASKRKVLMDDTMVLHGDTIRQQLTSTEDIRRVRKKAPCTRPEILIIQRQFLDDEIFREPIFTGMSAELGSLHSETYDLSGTRISEVDENHTSPEVAKDAACSVRPEVAIESGIEEMVHGDDIEAPVGTPQTESQQRMQHTDAAADVSESLHCEPLNEMVEMEIDKVTVADAANLFVNGWFELSSPVDPNQRMSTQPVEEDASLVDIGSCRGADGNEVLICDGENIVAVESEAKGRDESLAEDGKASTSVEINTETQPDRSVPVENGSDSLATYVESGGFLNDNQAADEVRTNRMGELNEDLLKDADTGLYGKDLTHMCSEEPKMDSMSMELDTGIRSLSNGEKPATHEVDAVDAEIATEDHCPADNQESGNITIANDTEFLNVDDEVGEEDEEGMPYGEENSILDNSGWSARTRAVAKYLQNLFDNEAVHGRKVLAMDNLLAGKTRKEAARMFFETLVLKTKDYIHVEQPRPLDNIGIKARAKLMKSDF